MEKCRYLLDCEFFDHYFTTAKNPFGLLDSGRTDLRTAALKHLTEYCNGPNFRICPHLEQLQLRKE